MAVVFLMSAIFFPTLWAEGPDACLTPEQRFELAARSKEVLIETTGLVMPAQMKYRSAKLAYERAVASAHACEQVNPTSADSCQSERAQADERLRELEVLGEERKRQAVDAMLRAAVRAKAIRAEYASCEAPR